jgi:hypothetical protein
MPTTERCPNCGAPAFDPSIGRCNVCLWQTAAGVHLTLSTKRDLVYSEISDGALIVCAVLSVIAVLGWLIAPVILVVRGADPWYLLLGIIGALQGLGMFILFVWVLHRHRAEYRHGGALRGAKDADEPAFRKPNWFW